MDFLLPVGEPDPLLTKHFLPQAYIRAGGGGPSPLLGPVSHEGAMFGAGGQPVLAYVQQQYNTAGSAAIAANRFVCLLVCLFACLFVCVFVCVQQQYNTAGSADRFVCLFVCLCVCLCTAAV